MSAQYVRFVYIRQVSVGVLDSCMTSFVVHLIPSLMAHERSVHGLYYTRRAVTRSACDDLRNLNAERLDLRQLRDLGWCSMRPTRRNPSVTAMTINRGHHIGFQGRAGEWAL
jgi:hypothetical protein